jgi:cystathionine gamma-synthase
MPLTIKVISKQPPGGRCTLYADYAEVLARHLGATTETLFSDTVDTHGNGYPALSLNDQNVLPADGVIIMPADIVTVLDSLSITDLTGLAESLEVPLERMMEAAG